MKHGSLKEYLEKWYSPDTKLMSNEFRGVLQRQGAGIWSRIPRKKRDQIRSRLVAMRGKPRADSFSQTGPGRTWEIVQLRTTGFTYQEIEEKLGVGYTTIHHRCQTLGFPQGRRMLFDFGQPFTWGALHRLRAASGWTSAEFASRVAISQAKLGRHPESQHVDSKLAKKIIAWRDHEVKALIGVNLTIRRRAGYRVDAVLNTFYPSLPSRHELLIKTLPHVKSFLNASPTATISELTDCISQQAQDETARGVRRRPLRDLLVWLPQLAPFLQARRDEIRSVKQIRPLALAILGDLYGAQPSAVDYVVRKRAPTISPKNLRLLLMPGSTGPRTVGPANKGGRPRGLHVKTEGKMLIAAAGNVCGLSKRQQRGYLAPGVADELAYSNSKKLHRTHEKEIKAYEAQLTPEKARAILDNWRQKHPEAGAYDWRQKLAPGSE